MGVCGWASSLNRTKNSSTLAAKPSATEIHSSSGASSSPSPTHSRMSPAKPLTNPATATLSTSVMPMIARLTRSRSLPNTKLGCSRAGISNITISASRIADSQPRPAYSRPSTLTIATQPGAALLEGLRRQLALVGPEDAGEQRLQRGGERVVGVGEDRRHPADDEEAERHHREERQEGEVRDRAGLQVALDVPVVLDHPHHVVDERPLPADLGQSLLGGGHQAPPPSG